MAATSALAASIAHEINNPLAYVAMSLELLERRLRAEQRDDLAQDLAMAIQGVARVGEIVSDLRDLVRGSSEPSALQSADLRRSIDAAIRMTDHEMRHRAQFASHVPRDLPAVSGDGTRLAQVFVNLLMNAAQAIPPGHAADHHVKVFATYDQTHVTVSVHDDGQGMDEATQQRVWQPFFTTKGSEGTGLGLSISRRILDDIGAEVSMSSALGEGTTVCIRLQRSHQDRMSVTEIGDGPPLTRARILVIDDEPALLGVVAQFLSGHEVVTAPSADDALAALQAGGFDAVVCDVMLPNREPSQLRSEILALRPELAARIIYITGGVFGAPAEDFARAAPGPLLHKPFAASALRAVLRTVLGR